MRLVFASLAIALQTVIVSGCPGLSTVEGSWTVTGPPANDEIFSGGVAQPGPGDADAEIEARLHAFSQQLRCLVCQNETLADSRAELAIDLRREIGEQMRAGRSDAQITAFLTARYGDFVLYRPPLKPSTYPLWFGPFVLLGGGLFALFRGVKDWPARSDVRPLSAAERNRARRLLKAHRKERA